MSPRRLKGSYEPLDQLDPLIFPRHFGYSFRLPTDDAGVTLGWIAEAPFYNEFGIIWGLL